MTPLRAVLRFAVLLAASAFLAPAAPAGATIVTGVSETDPAMFDSPDFAALHVPAGGPILPWDTALRGDDRAEAWLERAHAAGVEVMVAFEHAMGTGCPGENCPLPSVDEYRGGVGAFLAFYPWVHVVTPWNEPNHTSQPT